MKNMISSLVAVLVALLLALAVSHSAGAANKALIWILFCIAFGIQWLAFLIANYLKTEKFYDITGTITYLLVVWGAVYFTGASSEVGLLVASFVSVWSIRLGSYLLVRVIKDGEDKRFREIKVNPARFFLTWTLQGLWVFPLHWYHKCVHLGHQKRK